MVVLVVGLPLLVAEFMSLYGAKEIMHINNGNEAAADTQLDSDGMFPVPSD